MQKKVDYIDGVLNYQVFGQGSEFILCFHGVQQSSAVFDFLQPHLADKFTLVAIDLPFHGRTDHRTTFVSEADCIDIIRLMMRKHNFEKFHVLCYSIGAKFVNTLVMKHPEWLHSLLYIAPDGIKDRWVYSLATRSTIGRRIFKAVLSYPMALKSVLKVLASLKWVTSKDVKALNVLFDDKEKTIKLHQIWMGMSLLQNDLDVWKHIIATYQISTTIIAGKKDNIVPFETLHKLAKSQKEIRLIALDKGHQLLNSSIISYIKQHFGIDE